MSTTYTPTAEQQVAIDLAATRQNVTIEALAGTGKTSTLVAIAETQPNRRFLYLAFNKSIVEEAKRKFGSNVEVRTVHSAAYAAVVQNRRSAYGRRLDQPRQRPLDMARTLRCEPIKLPGRTLAAGFVASLTLRTVRQFCQTADTQISRRHVPFVDGIDAIELDAAGDVLRRKGPNNATVAAEVEVYARRYWNDVLDPHGRLPFEHSFYLKLWGLSRPKLNADVILFDEAQDADPVMTAVIADQPHAQVIAVGDTHQQIYAWRGAVNALAAFAGETCYLTQSFRFGTAVATVANVALTHLGASALLRGFDRIDSTVGPLQDGTYPDAYLARTNAKCMEYLMAGIARGQRIALTAGTAQEIKAFVDGAERLQAGRSTDHRDLAAFTSWDEVVDYVENDDLGSDLRVLVTMVEEHGCTAILDALADCSREGSCDTVVSTAHKAKGREWPVVQLAGDFPRPGRIDPRTGMERGITDEDVRLIYVAATRAQRHLDAEALEDGPEAFLPWARQQAGTVETAAAEVQALDLDPATPQRQSAKDAYYQQTIAPYL